MFDESWITAIEESEKQPDEEAQQPKLEDFFSPPPPPEPDWERVWTLLTEPRQIGLGEGLATEAWTPEQPPPAPAAEEAEQRDGDRVDDYDQRTGLLEQLQSAFEEQRRTLQGIYHSEAMERAQARIRKHVERWVGEPGAAVALHRRHTPEARYDARHHNYVSLVAQAHAKAGRALVDPYTSLIADFASDEHIEESWERPRVRAYAFASGANVQLGKLHVRNWSLRSAEAAFARALKADAHDPEAWWYLGVVRLFRRRERQAVRALRTACDYRPADARTRIALGLAHYHCRDYAAAEDCFRYDKGSDGRGVAARSFFICSARMQRRWDLARMEIAALSQHQTPAWKEMAAQCARCVDRGEGKEGKRNAGPSVWSLIGILLILAALAVWVISHRHELLELIEQPKSARPTDFVAPAALILLSLIGHARRATKRRQASDTYGDGKEDLPCWQTRSWMRPHRLDIFGQPMEIPRQ